ncbi:MAG: imidazole glycerol phosphate synthase subunit HisH [Candidatus Omnitrophica bacterium]|nr:imidazole glycerol phosphate synthase subunit HisH [Candidatus Omnitrophota bacterium]
MIVIVDYGMSNLRSVEKAVRFLGKTVRVSDSAQVLRKAKKIIFPGVGHFGKAVGELKKRNIFNLLKERIGAGVPFFGICLGMQLLFRDSEEAPGIKGLDVVGGVVKNFKLKNLIVPHMGWNQVQTTDHRPKTKDLFKGVSDNSFFYFAHSYYCAPSDKKVILTTTHYGLNFVSSLRKDNVWGVQFHPEKSQSLGLKVLNNFFEL